MAIEVSTGEASWFENLQHRADPNRVRPVGQMIASPSRAPQSGATTIPMDFETDVTNRLVQLSPPDLTRQNEPSYYDISMLKRPVWKWQIASYFYLGGLSAGAYLLARMAERSGDDVHRHVTRVGTWLAVAAVAPCPALLIGDLGDPKRFHHMLRVFKPGSPMNLGAWMLVGYSGMVMAAAVRELVRTRPMSREGATKKPGTGLRRWAGAGDLLGVPLAIGFAGYTGVLLSCTSNPLWCRNPWLGPLFSASAVSTGAEAISLLLDCTAKTSHSLEASQRVLKNVDTASHLAEAACLAGFQRDSGENARPLTTGSMRHVHKFAIGALLASEVLKHLPVADRYRQPVRMLAALTGLAAGFAVRWSMVYGGKEAADDPHLARNISRASNPDRLRSAAPREIARS